MPAESLPTTLIGIIGVACIVACVKAASLSYGATPLRQIAREALDAACWAALAAAVTLWVLPHRAMRVLRRLAWRGQWPPRQDPPAR